MELASWRAESQPLLGRTSLHTTFSHLKERSTINNIITPSPTMPKKGLEDVIWQTVERSYDPNKDHPECKCKACGKVWQSREISRIYAHRSKCPQLPEEEKARCKAVVISRRQAAAPAEPTIESDPRQVVAEQALAKWVSSASLPLDTIENAAFRDMMQMLDPTFVVPGKKRLLELMLEGEL